MEYGCIAKKLGHSFSAEIHSLIGGYDYRLREVAEDELDSFMKARDFIGINVTIPYKKDVIPYLSEMNDIAARIGSVNTVVNRGGKLYGYNTDYFGLKALIAHAKISLEGRTVLILGTGGTSVMAQCVASDLGAKEVKAVSRRPADGVITYREAEENYRDAEIIINTTPVGMFPENYAAPVDISRFERLEGVVDAVFNPLRTPLVLSAEKRGIKAEGGLYMLVAQAVYASEIFRDVSIPKTEIDRIFREVLHMKENIALTGMPACGKSATGRFIAEKLGRKLVDTDDEIVKRTGKEITEIFAELGEEGFRDIETEVIKDVCKRSGIVISTDWLTPTADRPTASDRAAIRKRYDERHERYISTADEVIIPADGAEINAKTVIERFLK